MTLKDLEKLQHAHDCSKTQMRPDYVPVTKFKDNTANGLTKAVIAYIRLMGGQAERISTQGTYIQGKEVSVGFYGVKRTKGKYIPSQGVKGSADISSTIRGLSVKWEVKMKDKQSEYQKQYQADIERAGGKYFIIHNFEEFINYYESL